VNELRVRTERAHPFGGNDEVLATLDRLAGRDEPLVVHLPRQSGQKETRWMHLLGGEIDVDALAAAPTATTTSATSARAGLEARVAELEDRVAALEELLRGRHPDTDPEREQSSS
jgi:uncharacterized protein